MVVFLTFPDINDCNPDPCENGGTCVDGVDSFTCVCPAGYEGNNCSISKCRSLSFKTVYFHLMKPLYYDICLYRKTSLSSSHVKSAI